MSNVCVGTLRLAGDRQQDPSRLRGARKLKVLFVAQTGAIGGAELSLLDVAAHFRERSQVALFADGPFRERLQARGVDVFLVRARAPLTRVARESGPLSALLAGGSLLALATRLARHARHFDLVHATGQKAFAVAAIAARLVRRPLVWWLHDMLTPDHFSSTNRRVAVWLANWAASGVVANSHATTRAFVDAGGRADLVTVIYYGIDSGPFDVAVTLNANEIRDTIGMPPDHPVIGVFGRLAPWKGQDVVLEALEGLPGAHAIFVGDAEFGEDAYRDSLLRQTERRGLADRVRYLGFRRDVAELMAACDLVVHSSTSPEPFGRVIVEGMLAGRPVIATRAGGAVEIIDDGTDGLLVEPGNPEALTAAAARILDDPELAPRLAAAGKRKAQVRFSPDVMLKELEQHMKKVLTRRGR